MKLLILGGTVFLGRHIVQAALERGHEVTLFNRGQHNPDLFPETEKLRGDRDGDLSALRNRHWEAVIDTSGYVPRIVRDSAELLADRVAHYTFISTISVYADYRQPNMDETYPVGTLADESVEEVNGDTYGPLKALCEQAVEQAMPSRALIIRPGLIVGPDDPTDRFTYWPRRVVDGGEVLAPGRPDRQVQIIDVRDLAEWTVRMAESHATGIFNATGPDHLLTMGRMLDECRAVSHSDAQFTWVPEAFLLEVGVQPWSDLPVWLLQETTDEWRGMLAADCRRAIAAGLTFRPLAETIQATLAWDATRPADVQRRAGLSREREAEVLRAWQESREQ